MHAERFLTVTVMMRIIIKHVGLVSLTIAALVFMRYYERSDLAMASWQALVDNPGAVDNIEGNANDFKGTRQYPSRL